MSAARSQVLFDWQQRLARSGYIAELPLVAAILLMQDLQRPLLLEGDAGVGKTEIAKVLSATLATRLIRLQCYEGLDAHSAMYEWNYQRQLLAIKLLEQDDSGLEAKEQGIFSERYLLRRPLLEAISCEQAPVLLIDEIDRADEAFEAYLLELLSDFQMSIPELGCVDAACISTWITLTTTRNSPSCRCVPPMLVSVLHSRWSRLCKVYATLTFVKNRVLLKHSTGPQPYCV